MTAKDLSKADSLRTAPLRNMGTNGPRSRNGSAKTAITKLYPFVTCGKLIRTTSVSI